MKTHLPHYSIDGSGDKFTITIPSKKQWFAIVLLLFLSSFWTMAGIVAIWSLFVDPNLFMLLWLGSGVITFIYKGATIRTGEVDEVEGNQILDAIRKQFPHYW